MALGSSKVTPLRGRLSFTRSPVDSSCWVSLGPFLLPDPCPNQPTGSVSAGVLCLFLLGPLEES